MGFTINGLAQYYCIERDGNELILHVLDSKSERDEMLKLPNHETVGVVQSDEFIMTECYTGWRISRIQKDGD